MIKKSIKTKIISGDFDYLHRLGKIYMHGVLDVGTTDYLIIEESLNRYLAESKSPDPFLNQKLEGGINLQFPIREKYFSLDKDSFTYRGYKYKIDPIPSLKYLVKCYLVWESGNWNIFIKYKE